METASPARCHSPSPAKGHSLSLAKGHPLSLGLTRLVYSLFTNPAMEMGRERLWPANRAAPPVCDPGRILRCWRCRWPHSPHLLSLHQPGHGDGMRMSVASQSSPPPVRDPRRILRCRLLVPVRALDERHLPSQGVSVVTYGYERYSVMRTREINDHSVIEDLKRGIKAANGVVF